MAHPGPPFLWQTIRLPKIPSVSDYFRARTCVVLWMLTTRLTPGLTQGALIVLV